MVDPVSTNASRDPLTVGTTQQRRMPHALAQDHVCHLQDPVHHEQEHDDREAEEERGEVLFEHVAVNHHALGNPIFRKALNNI